MAQSRRAYLDQDFAGSRWRQLDLLDDQRFGVRLGCCGANGVEYGGSDFHYISPTDAIFARISNAGSDATRAKPTIAYKGDLSSLSRCVSFMFSE